MATHRTRKPHRSSRAKIKTPAALHPYVHRHALHHPYVKRPQPGARTAAWEVPALCTAYDWPTGLAGGGVIAIVELGGGWVQSDLELFFKRVGQGAPTVSDVSVGGVTNSPGKDLNSDTEVALDIQVSAAAYFAAAGHPAVIRIYWASDIAPAVQAAAADGCDVCSISWGSDEANWGEAAAKKMEQVAAAATAKGMIVFAVCFEDITQGDNGMYRAASGPDPCSGLGSPIGARLAKLLTTPRAGQARLIRQVMGEPMVAPTTRRASKRARRPRRGR